MQLTRTSRFQGIARMTSQLLAGQAGTFERMSHPEDARRTAWEQSQRPADSMPLPDSSIAEKDVAKRDRGMVVDTVMPYRRRQGPNWGALALIVAVHVVVIGALLTSRMMVQHKAPPPPLSTFTLAPEPPPPAAPQPPKPTEIVRASESVTAPVQLVRTPSASPVQAAPPATPVAVAVVAPPAPAAVPAPPAPVTPPDFSASQLGNPGPAYPFLSRRAKEQGVVTLRVLVTEAGRAGEIRVETSSGFERLDKAALATVKRWKFLPARQAGKAVAAWVLVPVTFALG